MAGSLYLFVIVCYFKLLTEPVFAATITDTNRSVIPGESVSITCQMITGTVQWSYDGSTVANGDNGFTIIPLPSQDLSLLFIGAFIVDFEGIYTCADDDGSDTITLTHQEYSLTMTGLLPIVAGDEVDLMCNFESVNREVSEYVWMATDHNGDTRELSNSGSRLMIPALPASDNGGQYECSVTLNTTITLSTTINISIITIPEVIGPSVIPITLLSSESSYQLSCDITGANITYTWTVLGAAPDNDPRYEINAINGSLLYTGAISYSDTGNYSCTGSNLAGSVSVVYWIDIEGAPVILTNDEQSFTANEGTSLLLPCVYQSNPAPSITLSHASTIINNARYSVTDEGIIINSLIADDNGQFQCTVINEYGNDTVSYTLTIYSIPDAPVGLTVSVIQSQSVLVSWEPFVGSVLIKPDNYTINNNNNNQYTIEADVTISQYSYNITDLIPNTNYALSLSATNRAGISQPTSLVSFTTTRSAPKLQFFNIVSVAGGRSLRCDWSLMFDGGSTVTTFMIIITSLETTPITIQIDGRQANQGSYIITDLEPNTLYNIQTTLGNAIDEISVNYSTTTVRGPPSKPNQPSISDIQMRSVQITSVIPSVGSESVDYYLVNVSNENNILLQQFVIESDHDHILEVLNSDRQQTITLLITPLDSQSSYRFSMSAGGVAGDSPFSEYSDTITTKDGTLLYYIISGVLVGSAVIVLLLMILAASLYCVKRRKRRRISQKHTITDRLPNDFGFPNSSISENVHMVEEYSPPSSSMEIRKEDIAPPPPYTRHNRTHSVTSTASSQMMYRKPDYLRSPTEQLLITDTTDSAYGGSAEKGVNHVYHEIPPRCHSVSGGEKISFSYPTINRVTSYDVDSLPPRPNCATDV